MSDIISKLEAFRAEAEQIKNEYEAKVKAFYARLESLTQSTEFHEYGRENSMSYQDTNPLWEIDDMLNPHMYGIYGWMPSSWERC